jgi:hypothetical protein
MLLRHEGARPVVPAERDSQRHERGPNAAEPAQGETHRSDGIRHRLFPVLLCKVEICHEYTKKILAFVPSWLLPDAPIVLDGQVDLNMMLDRLCLTRSV